MFVVSLLAGFLSTAILALLRLNPMVALLGNQIVGAVLNVFLLGWVPSVLITMYYDLRLRHQGEDLAARVDALATR
jgi:hypothetical protein